MPEPVRDPGGVIGAIGRAATAYPDQRVAQLIVNATGRNDPFYVEDNDLIAALDDYAARARASKEAEA